MQNYLPFLSLIMKTFRFAVISDPHIALPQTIDNTVSRFHMVEVSIAALEKALTQLEPLNLDFLLIPGDLTQDGEIENHQWLHQRLQKLPFPCYVIPGNHDVPLPTSNHEVVGLAEFPRYYTGCGYQDSQEAYYTQELLPGVQLIALNSNAFSQDHQQIGYLEEKQYWWLEEQLKIYSEQLVFVMIHHNVIEHLPGQSHHELGRRYMLDNAPQLLTLLKKYQVKLIFTGHLHVQDIAYHDGIYEITTGSLVSYPHPYRIITADYEQNQWYLTIESHRIESVEGYPQLAQQSRQFLGDRSQFFMTRLLTLPPLNLSPENAAKLVPTLQYFWADVAAGDSKFDFPNFPSPVRYFLQKFSHFNHPQHLHFQDNNTVLKL